MNAYLPPLVIDVRVRGRDAKGFHIWLPFVLLWPLLLVVVGFALVVTALVDFALLMAGARYHHYTLFLLNSLRLFAYVRGTHVDAETGGSHVNVHIY